jgi:serine/threonine protein kinase
MLLDKIALGGMAELFRARIFGEQGFEKLIVIKRILPHLTLEEDLINAFIDEAKLAALLQHQNIVQIYDFGSLVDSYFIAMEHLFGKDLRLIVNKASEKGPPLSLEYALFITSRICEGLDYAHNLKDVEGKPLNIIHRDISPPNILVTYDGEVKIVDFGIAKAAIQNTTTAEGVIKGKVCYMSPEQARGGSIDSRTDIYSTGILLYEMVTRRRMYVGDALQILTQVRKGKFKSPRRVIKDLPTNLYRILDRALDKSPDQRYQSNGEMLSDLEECIFENSFRPNSRGLAKYMKKLFAEEIAVEEQVMREAAQINLIEEPGRERDEQHAETTLTSTDKISSTWNRQMLRYGALAMTAVAVMVTVIALFFKDESVPTPDKMGPTAPMQPRVADSPPTSPSESTLEEGIAALEKKRFRQAVVLFERVLAREPALSEKVSGPYVQALLGQAATLTEKDPQKAKPLLLKVIKLDPGNKKGHLELGFIYVNKLKDYPMAIKTYQKLAELDPKSSKAFFNLAWAYKATKDYSKAEKAFARVVELAPSFLDEALFNLAVVQEKQGKRDQSIKNLKRALKRNPNNKKAKKYLLKWKRN